MNLTLPSLLSSYFLYKVFVFYLLDGILKMPPLKNQFKNTQTVKNTLKLYTSTYVVFHFK